MKKLMVLATVLAMMLAAAAPAFAQNVTAINEGDDVEYNAVGQNLIGSVGDITTGGNFANANAGANVDISAGPNSSVAIHNSATGGEITQDSGVTIMQSNEVGNVFFGHWWFWF
ncbi:MAG: hypothetical protein M3Q49_21335 [Actinomycetota bacterium]|jgi:hypothetical protein|nr:hypothetical protein [Actinomycetota bacterium]MDP9488292.1 hypothetical protein [Actinomycetota bacterium]